MSKRKRPFYVYQNQQIQPSTEACVIGTLFYGPCAQYYFVPDIALGLFAVFHTEPDQARARERLPISPYWNPSILPLQTQLAPPAMKMVVEPIEAVRTNFNLTTEPFGEVDNGSLLLVPYLHVLD